VLQRLFKVLIPGMGAILLTSACNDYASTMTKKVQAALGSDFSGYAWSQYPTDNFGVITSYDPAKGDALDDRNFLCATWTCLGLKEPSDPAERLKVGGFADIGKGGVITLTEEEKLQLGATAMLPEIYKVLKISADVQSTKGVTTKVELGPVSSRKVVRQRMLARLKELPADSLIKKAFLEGRLVYVVADVVADSMTVDIKVDTDRNAKLDAELLNSLSGAIGKILKQGAKLELTVKKAVKGEYQLEVKKPVILAVLAKRQPAAGVLDRPGDNDWTDWNPAKVGHNLLLSKEREKPTQIE
jgi:hypothetical protein